MTETPPPPPGEPTVPLGGASGAGTSTTQPPPTQPPPDGAGWNADGLRDYRRLRRSRADRRIAGVAGGLGRHLDVDPTVLRVLFVVLAFFGGAGLVVYGAMWLLVPEDGDADGVVRTSDGTRNALLIGTLVLAGLLAVGDAVDGYGFPWPLFVAAIVLAALLLGRDSRRRSTSPVGAPAPPPSGATGAPAYGETPAWVPPPPYETPRRRRRGPLLFFPTLAMVALALGGLGVYDAAGGSVVDAAYPALALTVIGIALVAGSVFGRPGGLIALGLVAGIALAGSAIGEPGYDGERDQVYRPASGAELQDSYRVPAGRIELDLTDLDPAELDGRSIDLSANAGELVVVVPAEVDVAYDARVDYGGEIRLLGRVADGWSVALSGVNETADPVAELDLELDLDFGSIQVYEGSLP